MEQAAAEWRYSQMHDAAPFHDGTFPTDPDRWSATRTKAFPYHYRDGVTLWVAESDLAPHDHFLGGAQDCAECAGPSGRGVQDQEDDDGSDK